MQMAGTQEVTQYEELKRKSKRDFVYVPRVSVDEKTDSDFE